MVNKFFIPGSRTSNLNWRFFIEIVSPIIQKYYFYAAVEYFFASEGRIRSFTTGHTFSILAKQKTLSSLHA